MNHLKDFWESDYGPWILVFLFLAFVYWVAIDTVIPYIIVGGLNV